MHDAHIRGKAGVDQVLDPLAATNAVELPSGDNDLIAGFRLAGGGNPHVPPAVPLLVAASVGPLGPFPLPARIGGPHSTVLRARGAGQFVVIEQVAVRVVPLGNVIWLHVEDRQPGGARGVNGGANVTLADADGLGLRLREAHVYEIAVGDRWAVDITDAPEV